MVARTIITFIVFGLFAALLCNIDPEVQYGWISGVWHGMWFLPNLVRSWFSDVLFKAELYTSAYNVFYWIFSIISTLFLVLFIPFGRPGETQRY